MFFIASRNEDAGQSDGRPNDGTDHSESSKKRKRLFESPEKLGGYYPKRVPKACDRCRVKKVKCSGGQICARCQLDAVVCVTSSAPVKDLAPVSPEQLLLVQSQRDRLVRIISKIVDRQDPTESAKLQETLAGMGLSMHMLPGPHDLERETEPGVDIDTPAFDQVPSDVWLELYANLSGDDPTSFPANDSPAQDAGLVLPGAGMSAASNKITDHRQPFDEMESFEDMVAWSPYNTTVQ